MTTDRLTLLFVFFSTTVLMSGILTRMMIQFARQRGMLDIPNERSSHSIPIPRGGGLAIVTTVLAATLAASPQDHDLLFLSATSLIIALLGLLDDRLHLSARTRLVVQMVASCALVIFCTLPDLKYPFNLFGTITTTALMTIYLVWMTNLYNFMDGIDGMAAIQGIVVAAILSIVASIHSNPEFVLIYIALAGACAGFLWYNRSPAKVFMGDVGSGFLGFFFGGLSIVGAQNDLIAAIPLEYTPIIFAVFISDATTTVITRFLYGYDPTKPHREFGFHHLVRAGHTHSQISTIYGGITLLWSAPWLFVAVCFPKTAPLVLAVTYVPVIWATLLLTRSGQTLITSTATRNEHVVLGLNLPTTVNPRERTRRVLRVQMYRAKRGFRKAIDTRSNVARRTSEL